MRTWTRQECYDRLYEAAYDGTFPGGRANSVGRFQCQYRSEEHRCAIGLLIPDEEYSADMDDGAFTFAEILEYCDQVQGFKLSNYARIQELHDQVAEKGWQPAEFISLLNLSAEFKDVDRKEPR